MAEEQYGFTQVRTRLEEIVSAVRKKDTSLEKSLDLLEEGVRLANQCTELIDHADWETAGGAVAADEAAGSAESPVDAAVTSGEARAEDAAASSVPVAADDADLHGDGSGDDAGTQAGAPQVSGAAESDVEQIEDDERS